MTQTRWTKIQTGVYAAEGTSVQVIKNQDVAELWDITFLRDGVRLHAQQFSTMREARSGAEGWIKQELA